VEGHISGQLALGVFVSIFFFHLMLAGVVQPQP
jgi:hypothetical protein